MKRGRIFLVLVSLIFILSIGFTSASYSAPVYTNTAAGGYGLSSLSSFLLLWVSIVSIISLLIYIYTAMALMAIAKRTETPHRWMAWIPFLDLYLIAKIAGKSAWPVLLLIIPTAISILSGSTTGFGAPGILGISSLVVSLIYFAFGIAMFVFIIIWWWNICKKLGKPGDWALGLIVPGVGSIWGLIMMGILAWGKKGSRAEESPSARSGKFSKKAIFSFILFFLGIIIAPAFGSPAAGIVSAATLLAGVALGFFAMHDIKEKGLRGNLMAMIAVIGGFMLAVIYIMVFAIVLL